MSLPLMKSVMIVAIITAALNGRDVRSGEAQQAHPPVETVDSADSLWVVSTRGLSENSRYLNLDRPEFHVSALDPCGNRIGGDLDALLSVLQPHRTAVIHVHGNRMTDLDARVRGLLVYRSVRADLDARPLDFIAFSWSSEQTGPLIRDARDKAAKAEVQALYFAWLLRELALREIPTVVIGYSFGGAIATGGMHVLAGGSIAGRRLPGPTVRGAGFGLGLLAPAIGEDWLNAGGYHGLATRNIDRMVLMYNSRDAALRRFRLVNLVTRSEALGVTGPQRFAPRYDGSPVPVVSRDCAAFLGIRHSEVEYYTHGCRAGCLMANLIRTGPSGASALAAE